MQSITRWMGSLTFDHEVDPVGSPVKTEVTSLNS